MNSSNSIKLFVLISLLFAYSNAQRKTLKEVKVDVNTGRISQEELSKIPFDEPFLLTGTFPKTSKVLAVQLKYRIKGYCKRKSNRDTSKNTTTEVNNDSSPGASGNQANSLNQKLGEKNQELPKDSESDLTSHDPKTNKGNNQEDCKDYYSEKRHYYLLENVIELDGKGFINLPKAKVQDDKSFEILVDPLHDNEVYVFELIFFEEINTDEVQDDLKKEIVLQILSATDPNKRLEKGAFRKLNKDLSNIIKEKLGTKNVFSSDGKVVKLDNVLSENQDLQKEFEDITKYQNTSWKLINQLKFTSTNNFSIPMLMDTLKENEAEIKKSLRSVIENEEFKDFRNQVVTPSIAEIANESFTTIYNLILQDFDRWSPDDLNAWKDTSTKSIRNPNTYPTTSYLLEVLMGRGKIKGVLIEPTYGNYHLESGQLLQTAFIYLNNLKLPNGEFLIERNKLTFIINQLNQWIYKVHKLKTNSLILNSTAADMDNLYTDVFKQNSYSINASTIESFTTEKSSYLGLDVGLMFAPDINSSFFFEGINFHFRPVNRSSRLRDLRYGDKLWKRLSFSFGVAQRVGSDNSDGYRNLIGIGSPFVGAGFRLHKGIRVNGGLMWYKFEDQNPLISETSIDRTWFLSVSIDQSFSKIAKATIGI